MNTEVTIVLRSVTHAMKGKKLLFANGIKGRVVKPSPSNAEQGCGYGIAVAASQVDAAVNILQKNRVPIVQINRF